MIILFWTILLIIIYCYLGYPVILMGITKVRRWKVHKKAFEPTVSVVLSVYNEEAVIEGKIQNLISQDYPQDKMEILIGSDGSGDRTNEIIRACSDERVRLVESRERKGKPATLNGLVEDARHEIVVFCDARQTFAPNAIRELAVNFHDLTVGCVSGELIFAPRDGATAKGVNLYWNYEKFIRSQESRIHSMLGATGAIYAIRRELFEPIPSNIVLDDMVIPFQIIRKGYRAIYDESAKAFDEVADSPREEHRRKTRTLFGNYQLLSLMPGMLNPFTSPVAVQLFSHKYLRLLIPFFLIALFFINWALTDGPFYKVVFAMQILFYAMAIVGGLARHKKYGILKDISRLCYVPYVFCLLNFSALIGFLKFIGSGQEITWQKARSHE